MSRGWRALFAFLTIGATCSSCSDRLDQTSPTSEPPVSSPKTLPVGSIKRFVDPDPAVGAFVAAVRKVPAIVALDDWSERRETTAWRDVYPDGSAVFVYAILTSDGCSFVAELSPVSDAEHPIDLTDPSTAGCGSVPTEQPRVHVEKTDSGDFALAVVDWRSDANDSDQILASLSSIDWSTLAGT